MILREYQSAYMTSVKGQLWTLHGMPLKILCIEIVWNLPPLLSFSNKWQKTKQLLFYCDQPNELFHSLFSYINQQPQSSGHLLVLFVECRKIFYSYFKNFMLFSWKPYKMIWRREGSVCLGIWCHMLLPRL